VTHRSWRCLHGAVGAACRRSGVSAPARPPIDANFRARNYRIHDTGNGTRRHNSKLNHIACGDATTDSAAGFRLTGGVTLVGRPGEVEP
jgi:hypothetical protein